MTTSGGKPLMDWTEARLKESVRANAPHEAYPMPELVKELDRRSVARRERIMLVSTIAAAIAAIASAVAAVLSLIR